MSTAEKNYAQIEREALAIIFGVRKFHQYLYGCAFTLFTGHKPLTSILGPKTGIPTLAAARMQRWALILSAYQYNIMYRNSKENANADAMSRLPSSSNDSETERDDVFQTIFLDELPIRSEGINKATKHDTILSQVSQYILQGWPNSMVYQNPLDRTITGKMNSQLNMGVFCGVFVWSFRNNLGSDY